MVVPKLRPRSWSGEKRKKGQFDFHNAVVRELGLLRDEMGLAVGDTNTGRIGIDEPNRFFQKREDRWFDNLAEAGWDDVCRKRLPLERESIAVSPGASAAGDGGT